MIVQLLAPSDMELPHDSPATVDAEKKCVVVTPNSKYKTTSPIITGYVRVAGSGGAERKFVLLVNPNDGGISVSEEVSSQAAFDKMTPEEAQKKANKTAESSKKKK